MKLVVTKLVFSCEYFEICIYIYIYIYYIYMDIYIYTEYMTE